MQGQTGINRQIYINLLEKTASDIAGYISCNAEDRDGVVNLQKYIMSGKN